METRPRSVTVKKRWRGREESTKVTAMEDSTTVIRRFRFRSFSCRLASRANPELASRNFNIYGGKNAR